MNWHRALFLAPLLLAGCGTLQKTSPLSSGTDSQQWQLSGKLGLWGEQIKESATLNWLQCSARFRIRLSGPLGSSAAIITGDDQQVTLERSGEPPLKAATPEQLANTLGWPLPVSPLQYWILGRPVPQEAFRGRHDAEGQLTDMTQQGWSLRFSKYESIQGQRRPGRIELSDGKWRIKVIVRDWQLNPETCSTP